MDLEGIKKNVDLPQLFRELGANLKLSGNKYTCLCPFHEEKTPSMSIEHKGDAWVFHCFGCDVGGTIVDFIQERDNLDGKEAISFLLEEYGQRGHLNKNTGARAKLKSESQVKLAADRKARLSQQVKAAQEHLGNQVKCPEIIAKYGLSLQEAISLRLGLDSQDNLVIPILSQDGGIVSAKKRLKGSTNRYIYLEKGLPATAWTSPLQETHDTVFIVEGEMNAMAVFLTLYKDSADSKKKLTTCVLGMAGGSQSLKPYEDSLRDKRVVIYADDDTKGNKAKLNWRKEAKGLGAKSTGVFEPIGNNWDFADLHRESGKKGLLAWVNNALEEMKGNEEEGDESEVVVNFTPYPTDFEETPTEWVVDNMFEKNQVNILSSFGGVGKSALANYLAVCVANQQDFLGKPSYPVDNILYLDFENNDPKPNFIWRNRSLRGLGLSVDGTIPMDKVQYLCPLAEKALEGRFLLDMLPSIKKQFTGHTLLIVDAWEAALATDSNAAKEIIKIMSVLKRFAKEDITIVMLDHLRKPSPASKGNAGDKMPAGSVQKTNQARTVWLIEDVTPEEEEDVAQEFHDGVEFPSLLKLYCVKINNGRKTSPVFFKRRVTTDTAQYFPHAGLKRNSSNEEVENTKKQIFGIIDDVDKDDSKSGTTLKDLLHKLKERGKDIGEQSLRRILNTLTENRSLYATKRGRVIEYSRVVN